MTSAGAHNRCFIRAGHGQYRRSPRCSLQRQWTATTALLLASVLVLQAHHQSAHAARALLQQPAAVVAPVATTPQQPLRINILDPKTAAASTPNPSVSLTSMLGTPAGTAQVPSAGLTAVIPQPITVAPTAISAPGATPAGMIMTNQGLVPASYVAQSAAGLAPTAAPAPATTAGPISAPATTAVEGQQEQQQSLGLLAAKAALLAHTQTPGPAPVQVIAVPTPVPAPTQVAAAATPVPFTPTTVGSGGIRVVTSNPISISNPIKTVNPTVVKSLPAVLPIPVPVDGKILSGLGKAAADLIMSLTGPFGKKK